PAHPRLVLLPSAPTRHSPLSLHDALPILEVAAWREREAQSRDVPRGRVLKDDALGDIAVQAPTNMEKLATLRSLPRGFERSKWRSEEHTSELQSRFDLVCRLLLEKKKNCPTDSRLTVIRPETNPLPVASTRFILSAVMFPLRFRRTPNNILTPLIYHERPIVPSRR